MGRRFGNMSIATPLRHPLLLACLLYVVVLSVDSLNGLKLYLLEPFALAASDAEEAETEDLSDDERMTREIVALRSQNARQARRWPGEGNVGRTCRVWRFPTITQFGSTSDL